MLDFDSPGFKGRLKEDGTYEFLTDPLALPFEQGIAVQEITGEFKKDLQDKIGFTCFCMVHLSDSNSFNKKQSNIKMGDTSIILEENVKFTLNKLNMSFDVELQKNDFNHLGSMLIRSDDGNWTFEETKENIFYVMNHIINSLTLQYGVPIKQSGFLLNYKFINMYSILEAQPGPKKYEKFENIETTNNEKWDMALNHYRKSLFAIDPQTKFLTLYLGVETLRSLIKEELDINESEKFIQHRLYKEPRFRRNLEINTRPIFDVVGKLYGSVLFGAFREMRNAAAHHILDDGTFKSVISLKYYLEYYSAIPYLIEMFEGYTNCLTEIIMKKNTLN